MSSPRCRPGKSLWPELVGASGQVAAARIERENRNVDAILVVEGTFVTQDFQCSRVRVWINHNGVVARVPRIG